MKKEDAAKLIGVKEKLLRHFKERDPFNPRWELEGYINCSEYLYGTMVIFKLNNYFTEQVVVGTPKQKYPFDRIGRFKFPSTKSINIYEKYDGTNILGYGYRAPGVKSYTETCISFKTRLNPVLNQSRWGNWKDMWDEICKRYPQLLEFVKEQVESGVNPSFELYGARNKHLIEYKIPLDIVFLFGMLNSLENPLVVDPLEIPNLHGLPIARLEASVGSDHDLYSWYQKLRGEQEALNKFNDEGFIEGAEGFVWYLRDINGRVHQYKCKPESVESIHWSSSGISRNAIVTTIINAYEDNKEVTYEIVKELLLEEFTENVIEDKKNMVLKLMNEVENRIRFRERVLRFYSELGLDLKADKTGTMRTLSKYFDRKEMSKVYTQISMEIGGVK